MVKKSDILRFSGIIEKLREEKNIGYMEALVLHCETTGLEVELAAKIISNPIKAKIRQEAEEINLLKKSKVKKLPL